MRRLGWGDWAHEAKEHYVGMGRVAGVQKSRCSDQQMEALGGPHAVEQKQTNGLNGSSSVARRGGRRDGSPEILWSV